MKLASEKDTELVTVEGGKMGEYIPMIERGLLEGLSKGRQEGRQEILSKLLKANIDIQAICKATGLSKQEILSLQKT